MPEVHLVSPQGVVIVFKERVPSEDDSFIRIKEHDGRNMDIPKNNIAYIDNV